MQKKIRKRAQELNAHTYSAVLAGWQGQAYKVVRVLSAVMILLFLGGYAAAQLMGGSKALHEVFGWDMNAGAIIGAMIVLTYCFAGGIRASIWTDSAQVFVIIGGLALLCYTAIADMGGLTETLEKLLNDDPSLINPFIAQHKYGLFAHVLGWWFLGFGMLGMAHVMIRFMTVDKTENSGKALTWMTIFNIIISVLVISIGLIARAAIPTGDFDTELILPMLAKMYLPEPMVGLILASIFAATISTADSQILSCSAALTRDLTTKYKDSYRWSKTGTLIVTMIALLIALVAPSNVFDLVVFCFSALGCSLAPLLFVQVMGAKPSQRVAVTMILAGVIGAAAWRFGVDPKAINECLPGILASFAIFAISIPFGKKTKI